VQSRSRAELAVVAWGAITFGALLASYSAFRPVRDALILEGDPDQIPWLFTATFIALAIVSPAWGAIVARRPRHVVPLAFHAFAACALGFFVVIHAGIAPVIVGRVFYVWSAVFNLFVVSVFWSLLADLVGPDSGRRIYGPIAAGGTAGALLGPMLTRELVGTIGVAGVLVLSAALLELAVIGARRVRQVAMELAPVADADPPVPGGALRGIAQVVRSPYLAAIVGYVLCTACAATFVYLAQARIAHAELPDKLARTDFFASIDMWVAAATLVVQLAVAAPLIRWLGPGLVLCVLPIAQAIGIATLIAAPSLAAVAIVQVIGRTATHGLTRPARELLFTVVARDDKYRAKNVIDTVAYRLGDVASGWLDTGLVAAGGAALVAVAVPLSLVWLALAVGLGAGFARRVLPRKELA
jgi:AAA family ATP:ADP antiporter